MIDTAPQTNRLTNRSTAGEGHVVRHGDVRRVRKVIVGCPASRTLRGQPPAHNSSRYVRRTETVRYRLIRKTPTKPLPQPVAKAQTQEPQRKKTRTTTARALTRVYNPNPSFPRHPTSFPRKRESREKQTLPHRAPQVLPLSRSAGEGQGEGNRGGQTGGAPQTTKTHPSNP